jgi:hypothetical protein
VWSRKWRPVGEREKAKGVLTATWTPHKRRISRGPGPAEPSPDQGLILCLLRGAAAAQAGPSDSARPRDAQSVGAAASSTRRRAAAAPRLSPLHHALSPSRKTYTVPAMSSSSSSAYAFKPGGSLKFKGGDDAT